MLNEKIRSRFSHEIEYISHKVGVDAAIFIKPGEILLMDAKYDSGRCLPCGWVKHNEKPIDALM